MKKILALILVICMLTLTFVACGEDPVVKDTDTETEAPVTDTEAPDTEAPATETEPVSESEAETDPPVTDTAKLKVGFAKADITPDYSVPLAGDSTLRMSEGVNDKIYATVIVFEDGDGNRALLMTADLLHLSEENSVYGSIIRRLKTIGFSEENVILSATHTHSAPNVYSSQLTKTYNVELYKKILEAANAAIDDLSETDIYIGSKDVANMTFVRRYKNENGDFWGVNWPNEGNPVEHEYEADPELLVTKFVREGKKDIVLTNWSAHPTGMSGTHNKQISADYIGAMRDYVEDKLDSDFAFFQAAGGDTVTDSKIENLKNGLDTENYGKQLGMQVGLVLKSKLTQIDSRVSIKTNMTTLPIYKDNDPEKKPENINELILISEDFLTNKITPSEALKRSREAGVSSVYEAMKYRSLYGINKDVTSVDFRFVALTIGELTFASAPYEMFCQTGKNIKEASNAKMTFVVTHANGSNGYIATEDVFAGGKGYEIVVCTFKHDSATRIEKAIIELINKNYQ